jgi:hypothetical protein
MALVDKNSHLEITPFNEKAYCVVAVRPYLSTGKQDHESVALGVTYGPSEMARIVINKEQAERLLEDLQGLVEAPSTVYYEYTIFRRADEHTAFDVALSARCRSYEVAKKTAEDWRNSGTFGGDLFIKKRAIGEWVEA